MVLGAALPGLVFLMVQRTWAQYGPPPQPSIWAVPGAVVSKGSDVTIFCRVPPGLTTVLLVRFVPSTFSHDGTPQGAQEVFEFSLKNITQSNAGVYYCDYLRGTNWSRSSDSLELVVTGE
ncbi:leukocyte-associated immunoglobulin-like receptor 2 [Alexandromys fortis]|uniref:leukocyte-associated immunoglobulin-like receptor 2 n=1 Tax=Alexandromys fortis TaxID=100897 RepID=UPI0021535DA9|nr:leukocyte-associated immunoglobulin-like receptor 2 [Microtus fortis]